MSHAPAAVPSARPLPALGFLLAMLALGAVAISTLRAPPRIVAGLPEGARIDRARAALGGRLRVDSGELRFQAALIGTAGDASEWQVNSARTWILAAIAQQPFEPRLHAALGCLQLARGQFTAAERHYRDALDLASTFGEAHLGLGVALALRAAAESDEPRARGLRLRAISQFAAVPGNDPCHDAALFDRALLLARVGRVAEARRWARDYLATDPAGPWAAALIRALPGVGE